MFAAWFARYGSGILGALYLVNRYDPPDEPDRLVVLVMCSVSIVGTITASVVCLAVVSFIGIGFHRNADYDELKTFPQNDPTSRATGVSKPRDDGDV